jgi:hypothetical protein
MLRNLHRRALPLLVVFLPMSLGPGTAAAGGRERSGVVQREAPTAALEALESWLRAVDEHQPGVRDAAVATVSRWSGADLGALLAEGLLPLLRVCDRPVRHNLRTVGGITTPRRRDRLTPTEGAFIRQLAVGLCRMDGGLVRAPQPGAVDHMLRGGAILHGDAAMMALPDPETGAWPTGGSPRAHAPAASSAGMSMLADGTQTPVPNSAAAHWGMARLLVDQVRAGPSDTEPSPARDPMVRSWYRATLAFMAAIPYIDTTHFDRAEELFGDDAVVHLLIGSMREWMASDTVQRAIEEARRQAQPSGPDDWPYFTPRFPVGSAGAELGRSRRHLEHAVRLDASLTEARVRLGRVLGLAGNHRDAAAELRQAVASEPEPLLAYYAHLFLGAEEEAAGRLTEAREAYGQATSFYPDAATPRIALSHLMRRQGNRDQALRLIGEVLAPRSEQSARSDPMRRYHRSAGRHVKTMLREMVRLYLEAAPKGGQRATGPRH